MTSRIIIGDALASLRTLPSESVHCCVTSPPYWGLRDYGVAGQIGLEPTIGAYLEKMVAVFQEVRRVLRADGTAWVNMGDSHVGGGRGGNPNDSVFRMQATNPGSMVAPSPIPVGLKQKDLCGIPWRLAFALQADGWWLRQDIIWSKPNPMPESVTDRCTKAHEYIFLLSKSERYWFDADAIAEPSGGWNGSEFHDGKNLVVHPDIGKNRSGNKERKPASARGVPIDTDGKSAGAVAGSVPWEGSTRNKRSVWTVATQPFKEAHFATFPPTLIEPCILAGCPVGGIILDPFGGAGTTGLVADRLQRNSILLELNPIYAEMARKRIHNDAPLFAGQAHAEAVANG